MKIVTGCMRSGTSFVCNLLEKLGGNLGNHADHVSADEWNKKGYYETREINLLNNELLFGRWGDPNIWVDQMWPKDPAVKMRKRFTLMIAPLISNPSQIRKRGEQNTDQIMALCQRYQDTIIKDPRFSYMLHPWEKHGKIDKTIYCIRHPYEAAFSMQRQTSFPLYFTYMGWNDAIERFWNDQPKAPVELIDYNAFFQWESAEEEFKRLFNFLDKDFNLGEAKDVFDEVYDPKMRSSVADNKKLPAKTKRLYQELLSKHHQVS